ncbi:MAG: hypothetical protein ACTHU0_28585 [Kofleriaceae bacterium]
MRAALLVVIAAAACSDERAHPPAQPDASPADAPPPDTAGYPACAEFDGPGLAVPAHLEGLLAGADVVSPSSCDVVDAPYGTESAGPDRVVPLGGLTPGMPYVVKLRASSDLAFYVTTGCSTPSGPGADQCLLFQDASLGDTEVGRFIATAPTAYVVVDFYSSQSPSSSRFTLDVYEEACQTEQQCGGATPACSDGLCVQCETSFDCRTRTAPRCNAANTCQPGIDACDYDDPADPFDDGPAGARVLAPDAHGHASALGLLCSTPRTEVDFLAFDVETLGETWDFTLAWSGGRDLDLEAYDAGGRPLGLSYWEHPERIRLTYLPIGRYYLELSEFASTPESAPVSYALTAQRTLGEPCSGAADCAATYRNQVFRGACSDGACVPIDGGGEVPEGGACDSQSDCAPGLRCPSFFFVSDADTRQSCHPTCHGDADCGAGLVCTTYLSDNFCVPKCTEDDHCPTALHSQPSAGAPWYRLRCHAPTGRCLP